MANIVAGNKKGRKRVGLTYDVKPDYVLKKGDPEDANAEFDHPDTIEVIKDAIESGGHKVVKIGNVRSLLKRIKNLDVDIVFNIAEGVTGRNRESEIPVILEMAGIPFVGADGLTLGLTLDKVMAKKVLISEGVPTPSFFQVSDIKNVDGAGIGFPLIVKPKQEGSSKGISDKSIVHNRRDLIRQADWVIRTYKQPALVESFITGSEFTVPVVGNDDPEALPTVQISIDGKTNLGDLCYTFSRITSDTLNYVCPARITRSLDNKLKEMALRAYRAVECRDFGRVDFRVDKRGNPYVLEINPLPSLSTEDVFMVITRQMKTTYNKLMNRILDYALERYGIK
ncbi:MAG: ATP-grasp domain-containing protein [Candidatus Omnitrophica bacterium]|nr:ATP-grasp domain-containing protein [Candidatus Omnitrophota bacterium]MDD5737012.1 ATP-grasp domain-containing protein [Candidatus Omnitrophota bacterium]